MNEAQKLPKVAFGKVRKGKTVPDQSMSIREIVKRFVRGVPVDIQQRQGVYVDQSEIDLEKVSRADFGEKAEMAQMFEAKAASIESALQARATELAKEQAQVQREQNAAAQPKKEGSPDPVA